MPVDPLAFGVDLASVQTRIEGLGTFLLVGDIGVASQAMQGLIPFNPPAAFVSVANEQAQPNKIIGGYSQLVGVRLSVLFCVMADQGTGDERNNTDRTRKALMRQLVRWTPDGAAKALEYDRYLLRRHGDGLVWGEVLFLTSYRFEQ